MLRKLGQLVGLSPSYLSEIEHGRRMPPRDEEKIHDLALVLNLEDQAVVLARVKQPEIFKSVLIDSRRVINLSMFIIPTSN